MDEAAIKLVKDALTQGKSESEIVAFMKEAGYSDSDIVQIMAATKEAHPDNASVQQLGSATMQQVSVPVQPTPEVQPQKPRKKMIAVAAAIILAIGIIAFFLLGGLKLLGM